ncbi:hypothetical protein BDN71DRAFT_474105 [Pleurotus eryngii]|uniref:Uncharacterized protein n=1 Tax=Pleurotus eryngii TaxID=5323 RepID=A0A9P6A836_PLEER|nr:hypothetical protein BDN71DRAFT_474105 [Pleurotus eryngii]
MQCKQWQRSVMRKQYNLTRRTERWRVCSIFICHLVPVTTPAKPDLIGKFTARRASASRLCILEFEHAACLFRSKLITNWNLRTSV